MRRGSWIHPRDCRCQRCNPAAVQAGRRRMLFLWLPMAALGWIVLAAAVVKQLGLLR